MAIYYVKPTGDDLLDGKSSVSAWASLYRASQETYAPGDVVWIDDGTYNETQGLEFKGGGSAVNPVSILADAVGAVVVDWGSSRQNGWKLNVTGVGFFVRGLVCTQDARGTGAGDRQVVSQRSDDLLRTPSDVVFSEIESYETYEAFKASAVSRIVFQRCHAHDATIALGIVGFADDCEVVDCLMHGFTADGIQTKGGSQRALVHRNVVVGDASSGYGITLGGNTELFPGDDWADPDGLYEGIDHVAHSNLVIGTAAGLLYGGINFQGALDCVARNNTVMATTGVSFWSGGPTGDGTGVMDGFVVNAATHGGWTHGNRLNQNVSIRDNVIVRCAATMEDKSVPSGVNEFSGNRYHANDWITDGSGGNGWNGDWDASDNANVAAGSADWAAVATWEEAVANYKTAFPQLGAGLPVTHRVFG